MTSRRSPGILGAVFVAVGLGACDKNPFGPNPGDVDFAPSLEIDLGRMTKTSSGLYYEDTVVGSGALATAGDSVSVNFSGWFADGTLFDGGSFSFLLGSVDVISGVDEGVTGMKVGGIRRLVIPSSLAYGSDGTRDGIIPRDAVLVFEIELTAVTTLTG